jgi:hypothetical protein
VPHDVHIPLLGQGLALLQICRQVLLTQVFFTRQSREESQGEEFLPFP